MRATEGSVDIEEDIKQGVKLLRFKGRLDALSAPEVERHVFRTIEKGHHRLIFNFASVDYLSSAGMRMLLSTSKRVRALDGKVVLTTLQPNVLDVLKISGFDNILEIADTEEEAFRHF